MIQRPRLQVVPSSGWLAGWHTLGLTDDHYILSFERSTDSVILKECTWPWGPQGRDRGGHDPVASAPGALVGALNVGKTGTTRGRARGAGCIGEKGKRARVPR